MRSRTKFKAAGVSAALVLLCVPLAAAQAENLLDTLLADYRTYGLPLPPRSTRLAIATSESPQPAFLLVIRPTTEDRRGLASDGVLQRELRDDERLEFAAPSAELLKRVEGEEPFLAYWTPELGLAIQCYCLGWNEFAQALFDRDRRVSTKSTDRDPKEYARDCVLDMAWEYYRHQLCKPHTDRRSIAGRMRKLLDTKRESLSWGHDGMQELYSDLLVTLKPSLNTPGSIGAAVDQLTNYGASEPSYPAYYRLEALGLEAVPTLFDHLNDRRLTRQFEFTGIRSGKARAGIVRIGDVAASLLCSLAGETEYEGWWTLDEDTWIKSFRQDKAQAWLKTARALGEEEYFAKRLYHPPDDEGKIYPDRTAMRVLATKYPARLRKEYQRALTQMDSCEPAEIADLLEQIKERSPRDAKQ